MMSLLENLPAISVPRDELFTVTGLDSKWNYPLPDELKTHGRWSFHWVKNVKEKMPFCVHRFETQRFLLIPKPIVLYPEM